MKIRLLLSLCLGLLPLLANGQAAGFPNRPLRIMVPFTAGSGADSDSRFYGDLLSRLWGQPVLVENRPGGSGVIAVQAVKNAPPDGHTLLMATNSPMTVNPVVMKNLPYDPMKDFRPVIGSNKSPVAFIVKGDSPYKTMRDMVEATRKSGHPLAVGNYSAGYELVASWLGTVTGLEITHVPYKGGAPMMTDVIGGQVTTGAIDFSGTIELLKERRLRALAITADVRHAAFPDIPTMKESGYPDFETWVWSSFFVRSETPDDVTQKLFEGFRRVMSSPEGRAYRATKPATPLEIGGNELRAFVTAEYERFKRVAQAAGIQPR